MKAAILLFIILLSACARSPELIIPDAYRDKIFTEAVNPVTDKHRLEKLRETNLSGDDFEIRVWIPTDKPDGFILKRVDDEWSAIAIKEFDCKTLNYYPKKKPYELGKIRLSAPRSGWEKVWKDLSENGILDLPEVNERYAIHGISYIVETNHNGIYRTYYYNNPQIQKSGEAKRMVKISEIIADEFGLSNFKFDSLCLEK